MPSRDFDPVESPLFAPWTDPESGVTSYLLGAESVASARTFGCGNPVATSDGRYLWTVAETASGATVAAIDAAAGEIRRIAPAAEDPVAALEAGSESAFVPVDCTVYRADPDGTIRPVGRYGPADGGNLVSGLTVSADGDRVVGVVERDGSWAVTSLYRPTGTVDVWHSGTRRYGRVLCSPTDPTVVFLAGPYGTPSDPGGAGSAWLAREGLGARPVHQLLPDRHRCHWWNPDGAGLWYVEPGTGVGYLELEVGHSRTVWNAPRVLRAHATADGTLLAAVLDGDDRRLAVHDPNANATLDVASTLSATADVAVNPQFIVGDTYLAYTTTVRDRPTLAVTPTDALRSEL